MNTFTSSLQPHVSPETPPKFLLGSNLSFSLDSPNLLYHGFPRRAVESTGINLARKRGKKAFPFLDVTSLWLCVHSANNPHDRLYLISFTLPLQYFLGGKGKNIFPNPSALLLLFIKPACKRAGKYRRFCFLLWSRRAPSVTSFPFSRGIRKHFLNTFALALGNSEFSTRWLVVLFFFGLLSFLISLLFLLLG